MPIEWVNLTQLSRECGIDKRTFIANYLDDNPPQRHVGDRKSWTRTDANRIKKDLFGVEVEEVEVENN